MTPRELAELEPEALAERLLALAGAARRAAVDGDLEALADLRDTLVEASDATSGAQLALLEVAAAFVEALARSDLSPQELAIRAFCVRHPEEAAQIFQVLFASGWIELQRLAHYSDEIHNHIQLLVNRGVLRRADGVVTIQPRFFSLARDLADPPAFRMWRAVKQARERAAFASPSEAATILEGVLGVTEPQARSHLIRFPLRQEVQQVGAMFKAKPWSRPPTKVRGREVGQPEEGSNASQPPIPPGIGKVEEPKRQESASLALANETNAPRLEPGRMAN